MKQEFAAKDMIENAKQGKKIDPVESHAKFYDTQNEKSLQTISSRNINKKEFRNYLINGLVDAGVLGKGGKVEQRLMEGLDAYAKGEVDFRTRLDYIKEINKIAGVYAPERQERLNLSLDISEREMEKQIQQLREELE